MDEQLMSAMGLKRPSPPNLNESLLLASDHRLLDGLKWRLPDIREHGAAERRWLGETVQAKTRPETRGEFRADLRSWGGLWRRFEHRKPAEERHFQPPARRDWRP